MGWQESYIFHDFSDLKSRLMDAIQPFLLLQYSDRVSVLWRLAKANHTMSTIYGAEGDNEKKKEFVFQGI